MKKSTRPRLLSLLLLIPTLFSFFNKLCRLLRIEAKEALRGTVIILVLAILLAFLLVSMWFSLLAILFLYLLSMQWQPPLILLFIFALNFILLLITAYTIRKVKNKLFFNLFCRYIDTHKNRF